MSWAGKTSASENAIFSVNLLDEVKSGLDQQCGMPYCLGVDAYGDFHLEGKDLADMPDNMIGKTDLWGLVRQEEHDCNDEVRIYNGLKKWEESSEEKSEGRTDRDKRFTQSSNQIQVEFLTLSWGLELENEADTQ